MKTLGIALIGLILAASPVPAVAGASSFTLVNGTQSAMSAVSIRHFESSDWRPLADGAAPGTPVPVRFSDEECAFDIQATLAGVGPVVWKAVNLCEANVVTLQRSPSGATWAEYN